MLLERKKLLRRENNVGPLQIFRLFYVISKGTNVDSTCVNSKVMNGLPDSDLEFVTNEFEITNEGDSFT